MDLTSKVRPSQDAFFSQVSDEIVMLNLKTGCYHSLNTFGAAIWQRLDKSETIGDVCSLLGEIYEAPAKTIQTDTLEFLGGLSERGLVIIE